MAASGCLAKYLPASAQPTAWRIWVPVVGIKPIVAGLQGESGSSPDRLMPGARYLEVYLLLALEHDLPVVKATGGVHNAVGINQLLAGKPVVGPTRLFNVCIARQLGIGFRNRHALTFRAKANRAL